MGQFGRSDDWDDEIAELHYADTPEYATGHGVSADRDDLDGQCRIVRTAWIGEAKVEVPSNSNVADVELSMQSLASISNEAEFRRVLDLLVVHYRGWIDDSQARADQLDGHRKKTALDLLRLAGISTDRTGRGIEVLENDAHALDAFRVANRAVGRPLGRSLEIESPS